MDNFEDDNVSEILEATGDRFFECLETQLKTSIPQYVKNILKMNGFYNAFMMSKLVSSKISEIESFMKNDFADFMIPDAESVDDYLGVYKSCQNKFKFLCGHKTLLEIMAETCKNYYPANTRSNSKHVSKSVNENIGGSAKEEIFQKLTDGVATWLNSQGKFKQVLRLDLNFIINCEIKSTNSDEISYTMKCPVSSCKVDKPFSVIWKSYPRSTKNKSDEGVQKLCQPRWFFCSLKNHFQKQHLDSETIEDESTSGAFNDFEFPELTVHDLLSVGSAEKSIEVEGNDIRFETESHTNSTDDAQSVQENQIAVVPTVDDPILSEVLLHIVGTSDMASEHINNVTTAVKSKIVRVQKVKNTPMKGEKNGACERRLPAKRLRK